MRAVIIGVGLAIASRQAAAQATFPWPSRHAAVETYQTPEQCLSAVDRELRAASWGAVDTLPWRADRAMPAETIATARRCAARWTPSTVASADLRPAVRLFLLAGRDADAERTMARLLAEPADTDFGRPLQLREMAHLYLDVRPARMDAAERAVAALDSLGLSAARERLAAHEAFITFSRAAGNDTAARRHASAWLQIADALSAEQRTALHVAVQAPDMAYVTVFPLLGDSGTAAIARLTRVRAAQAMHMSASAVSSWVGKPSVPVTGIRFDPPHQDVAYGARRPPTLLVYVDDQCQPRACYPAYAMLRRLAHQFGEALQITLVSHTRGNFHGIVTPDTLDEARRQAEYFLQELALPGTLIVSVTPLTRRPDPDRRIVDGAIPNFTYYGVPTDRHSLGTAVLVLDRDGRTAFRGTLRPSTECAIAHAIEDVRRMPIPTQ